jgi:outer membrane immunogenic protein
MHVSRRLNTPRIHLVASRTAAFTTDGNHKDGYTVGAGLEYMFAPNWSAKLEYQYYNFGSSTFLTGPVDILSAPGSPNPSTPSRPASTTASTGATRWSRY